MVKTLLLSVVAFIGTNIDDLFINTLFFSEAATSAERKRVVVGKYIGIGVLTALSVLGALGLQFLPPRLIGYLGIVPIFLGVREILTGIRSEKRDEGVVERRSTNRLLNAALITVANGADNLGVYIPLFTGYAAWQFLLTACVFAALTGVWCLIGKSFADLPALRALLNRYKGALVPAVYIGLGAYILLKNIL